VCVRGTDCCTGVCNIPSGLAAGTCGLINSTGAGSCLVDGQACTSSESCCSRECVPTAYGGHACQVASGCRVEGDACTRSEECCSFPQTGSGACVIGAGQTIGRCRSA
jgi:hypothetical protein